MNVVVVACPGKLIEITLLVSFCKSISAKMTTNTKIPNNFTSRKKLYLMSEKQQQQQQIDSIFLFFLNVDVIGAYSKRLEYQISVLAMMSSFCI